MTQVSRRHLPTKVNQQIFDMFLSTLSSLSGDTTSRFIDDLLSPTEQVMLGKRLAIAYMLQKGYDQRTISQTLKVSLTTVSKISTIMQKGQDGYQRVIAHMLKSESISQFFTKIDRTLDRLLPPKNASWKAYYAHAPQSRRAKHRAF